ncbi:MAG: tyrosine-type recombinase/integrase [Candidatus Bathyarchaeia archaeon]
MERQGYRHATCYTAVKALRRLSRRVNLLDTEAVKTFLATVPWTESSKERMTNDLVRFYGYKTIPFDKPRYKRVETLPFIPLESEVQNLISGVGKKTTTFLQLIKETGCRPGEAWNLRWIDIDVEKSTVSIRPEKNSNPRVLKISNRLVGMLSTMPKTWKLVFRNPEIDEIKTLGWMRRSFQRQRKRMAVKLQNPRIEQISFRTLRHFKATMEYHRTKDVLHVMRILGHRNIKNTLRYTQLIDFETEDYVCKVAKTISEASSLIENGFEYVTDFQDTKLFRKRK